MIGDLTARRGEGLAAGVARGTLIYMVGGVATALSGVVVTVLVTRALGASQAGLFFEAVAVFSILSILGQVGSGPGLVRAVSGSIAQARSTDARSYIRFALTGVAAVSTSMGVLLFVLAPALSDVLVGSGSQGQMENTLQVLAVFVPFACLGGTLLAATRGFGTIVPTALVDGVGKAAARVALVTRGGRCLGKYG